MANLEWLTNWFNRNSQNFKKQGIVFSFSEVTKTDDPAQFVDLDTEKHMARLTLWESGNCDFEMIENETPKQIVYDHQLINSEMQLSSFLTKAFSKLSDLT